MNGTLVSLLQAVSRSLREVVQPELSSDHARSQLAGATDILSKLEKMADWSAAMRCEEQHALDEGNSAVMRRAAGMGIVLPPPSDASSGDMLNASHARMRQLIDWSFDANLEPSVRDEIDGLLRRALRDAVAAQRRRIPPTDFSSMTASTE